MRNILFISFLIFGAFGQPICGNSKDLENAEIDTSAFRLQEIEQLMGKGGHILAVKELEKICAFAPKSYHSHRLLGKSYLALQQFEKAEAEFEKLKMLNSKKPDPNTLFHLAYSQYRQGKMKPAVENLERFEKSRPPYKSEIWAEVKLMKLAIAQKENLITSKDQFVMDSAFQFPNSGYADFSPVMMGDSIMIFSSLRRDSLVEVTPGQPNFNTIQLFKYTLRQDGQFDELAVIRNLNKAGYHNGNGSFSSDGKRFFFSRCTDGNKGQIKCAIYEAAVKKDGSFHKVKRLSERINKRKYSSSQPFFITTQVNGLDQDVLFFVTDRKTGFGKNDIWYSLYNRKRKRFGAALNCGIQINSTGNDESPYFTSDKARFFFSSDGHPGFGGKDVFSATVNGIIPTNRELLPKPINSTADDHNFYLMPDGKSGFLASNRAGANLLDQEYCCSDIFHFISTPIKPIPVQEIVISRQGSANSEIEMELVFANSESQINQKPLLEVDLLKENHSVPAVLVKNLEKENPVVFASKPTSSRKVFFAKNSAILSPKSKMALDRLVSEMESQHPIKVILAGFADQKGNFAYNQNLAAKRALAVKKYFQKKKVKAALHMESGDLSKASKTDDQDMLSLDRYVEISWTK